MKKAMIEVKLRDDRGKFNKWQLTLKELADNLRTLNSWFSRKNPEDTSDDLSKQGTN